MCTVALHKSFAYTNIFENEMLPTALVQQGKQVDVVGCSTSLAKWSACLSLIFCKFLVGASRFIVCALHPPAPRGYGPAYSTNIHNQFNLSLDSLLFGKATQIIQTGLLCQQLRTQYCILCRTSYKVGNVHTPYLFNYFTNYTPYI